MALFYFTYVQEGHPFCGGWTEVEAPNGHAACAAFRAYHPDKQDGFINCAGIYGEADFQATKMPQEGNYHQFRHERITITNEKETK